MATHETGYEHHDDHEHEHEHGNENEDSMRDERREGDLEMGRRGGKAEAGGEYPVPGVGVRTDDGLSTHDEHEHEHEYEHDRRLSVTNGKEGIARQGQERGRQNDRESNRVLETDSHTQRQEVETDSTHSHPHSHSQSPHDESSSEKKKGKGTNTELQDQTNLLPTKQVILVFIGLTFSLFGSLLDQTMYVSFPSLVVASTIPVLTLV